MRAVLLEPLIVATSLPFASGLARFTSCELPKEAGLFSPDIFLIQLLPWDMSNRLACVRGSFY
jgi:hypothetical protein